MSNQIDIYLALHSLEASANLQKFLAETTNGLKRFAEEAVAAFLSFEGLRKIFDIQKDALQLQEQIGRLHQATGLSVESLAALRTASVEVGVPFDSLKTSVSQFSRYVYEAATQGGRAADAFRIMGVSLVNTDGTLRETDAIFRDFIVRFNAMPEGAQKSAFAMELLGRSARDAIPVLNATQAALGEFTPITAESVAAATEFDRTVRESYEAIENLFIILTNKLLPSFQLLADQFKSLTTEASSSSSIVTALVAVFKGLVTAVVIAGVAFYDLGKFIGEDANLIVDNFNVAIDTAKALLKDLAQLLIDDATLVMDFLKSVATASEVKDALLTGHFGTAKDLIVGQFETLKGDVVKISGDIGNAVSDVFAGVARGTQNVMNASAGFALDILGQYEKVSSFLKDLYGDTSKPSPSKAATGSQAIVPVSQENIKNLSTLQGILASIAKQNMDLINNDPFKSQAEKIAEMIPLLEQQKDIIFQEYAVAQAQLNNPNLNEAQRLSILKDLVKLQGELNALEKQETDLKLKGDFVGQMQAGIIKLNDRVTDFSTNAANLSLMTMQRMVDGVSQSIYAAMQHTKNWGEAFSRAMGQAVQGIIQMVTQWIAGRLAMMAVDTAFSATSKANSASTTAANVPAGISQAGAQGGWVGILIYVGVFLAAMAALMAITSAVARERGGPVSSGMPYIVGEKRPELFVPDQSGFIMPEVPSAGGVSSSGSGGSPAPVNLHFHGGEADAMKAMKSTEGQNYIVDLNRKNVKRFTRA